MNLLPYLQKKLSITFKEAILLKKVIKEYISLKEKEFINNEYLSQKIVKQLNNLADDDGELVLSDMFEVLTGNMSYFMTDPVGQKFFSLYSHGMNIKNLNDFDPDTTADVSEDEIEELIKTYTSEIDLPHIDFKNPLYDKMYRELYLYKYIDIMDIGDYKNVLFNIRDIKKYISENPEFKRIFDQKKEGKTLITKIANKEIKSFQDAIDYLKNLDTNENMDHGNFLVDENIELDIKKWKTDRDTYFKKYPHYVFVVSLTEDAYEELKKESANYPNFKVPHFGTLDGFLDYYKDGVHSHTVVTMPNKFCIGWVRFTIFTDNEDRKNIIIDELQSDLNIVEKFDKYKTGLPEKFFKDMFVSQDNLYTFILKQFIKEVREKYGYQKIYAVEYDTKVNVASSQRDYSKYKSIPREDSEYLQQMKPPRFPYEDIIKKNFTFSKTKSEIPGFLLLENTKKGK